jgi:hypothetical protein
MLATVLPLNANEGLLQTELQIVKRKEMKLLADEIEGNAGEGNT